jgi:hypothetical protein
MFFSKIWFVLLAVLAAMACGVALVVSKPALREVNRAEAEGLDRIQHNTELILRLQARDWIDAAASLSRDRVLVETLEQASDTRAGDFTHLKGKAERRLRSLTKGLNDERRPELMIAVDVKGRQIVRLGPGQDKYTPGEVGLAGYPLVEAALRGYRRDDSWSVDGKLFLMVSSPVISRGRGRYVGAILLGRAVNADFIKRMKGQLGGTDLAFFLRGSQIAATLEFSPLAKLPRDFERRREQIDKDGRSPPVRLGSGASSRTVIMAPVPGEASGHDAFYALCSAQPKSYGLTSLLGQVRGQDVGWGSFPWLLFGGGLLVVLVVGLGVMVWEGDLPTRRLLDKVEELARGEAARLEDRSFPGKFGSIARSLNTALDRAEKRAPAASKDLKKILGSPEEQGTRPDLRMDPSFSSMPPLASAPGVKHLETLSRDPVMPEGEPPSLDVQVTSRQGDEGFQPVGEMFMGRTIEPEGDLEEAPELSDAEEAATEIQETPPQFAVKEPKISKAPAAPISIKDAEPMTSAADSFSLEPSLIPSAAEPEETPSSRKVKIPESEKEPVAAHAPLPPLDTEEPEEVLQVPPLPDKEKDKTPVPGKLPGKVTAQALSPPPIGERVTVPSLEAVSVPEEEKAEKEEEADPSGDLKEYFRQVYNSFLSVKRQCGENVDNLTLERFEAKLKQNRAKLVERYNCKAVKFQVYIKDGKAAIKATPIKD